MKAKWMHGVGIICDGQATFISVDPAYGSDSTVIFCRCGHHPRAFHSSPSLSQMTTHDIMDLLEKMGYRSCDIRDDGNGRINVFTSEPVEKGHQQMIESCMPAGIKIFFAVKSRETAPVPKGLEKWAQATFKELKKS